MADIAEQNMQRSSNFVTGAMNTLMRFFDALLSAAKDKKQFALQVALAKWVGSGNQCLIKEMKNAEICDYVTQRLRDNQIPYMKTPTGILIRDTEYDKAFFEKIQEEAEKELLFNRVEVNCDELENKIAKYGNSKELFFLNELTDEEIEVFRNKSNGISKSCCLGIDSDKVCFLSSNLFKYDPTSKDGNTNHDKDFSKVYLQSMMSLYGLNKDIKLQQMQFDVEFDKAVAQAKNDNSKKYFVVSPYCRTRFIEIDANGYITTNRNTFDGSLTAATHDNARHNVADQDYDAHLRAECDKFRDKVIISDEAELIDFLNGAKLKSARPQKSESQERMSIGEDVFCDKLDRALKDLMYQTGIFDKNKEEQFEFYQHNAVLIMDAIANNRECPITKPAYFEMAYSDLYETAKGYFCEMTPDGKTIDLTAKEFGKASEKIHSQLYKNVIAQPHKELDNSIDK